MIFTNNTVASILKLNGSTMSNGFKCVCRLAIGGTLLQVQPDTGYTLYNTSNSSVASITQLSQSFLYYNSAFYQL
jgi:hypothetical protein